VCLPHPTLPRTPLAACACPLTDFPLRSGDFPTLPRWDKLLELGLSPADIAAEAAHWKGYAGSRNLYAWDEAMWLELAGEIEQSVPIPKEALKKAATDLPMCFVFAFGKDETKALVKLIKSWGMKDVAAIDTANAIIRVLSMPVVDNSDKPYATEAGKKLGHPFEVDAPKIPGGSPEPE
jgi:hypothetical protein